MLSRWVLPPLGSEPLTIKNLAEKAWPTVAALTTARQYTDQIECIEWGPNHDDDGTPLLNEYARTSRAVVLKGYGNSSPATPWTFERVKREVGETKAAIRVGEYASAPGEPEVVTMRVADFIDTLLGRSEFPHPELLVEGLGPYLGNIILPTLARELPLPRFFPETPNTTFWLGDGSRTPLHCHQHMDGLFFQLIGRRSIILIPPHQAALVGCMPVNVNICTAALDPFSPNRHQFPGIDLIHRLRYELEPGDALLIPGFWFHATRLEGPSLAGSHFRDTMMPAAIGGGPKRPWQTRAYSRGW